MRQLSAISLLCNNTYSTKWGIQWVLVITCPLFGSAWSIATKVEHNVLTKDRIVGELWVTNMYIYWETNVLYQGRIVLHMMTSSNGNIFGVTDPLCGEFTGHRWIPLTRSVTQIVDVFYDLYWIYGSVNNREAGDSRRHRANYDVILMS